MRIKREELIAPYPEADWLDNAFARSLDSRRSLHRTGALAGADLAHDTEHPAEPFLVVHIGFTVLLGKDHGVLLVEAHIERQLFGPKLGIPHQILIRVGLKKEINEPNEFGLTSLNQIPYGFWTLRCIVVLAVGENNNVDLGEAFAEKVKDKIIGVVDDMLSTGTTLERFYHEVKKCGAREVYALITHGVNPSGISRIKALYDGLYLTNTVNVPEANVMLNQHVWFQIERNLE